MIGSKDLFRLLRQRLPADSPASPSCAWKRKGGDAVELLAILEDKLILVQRNGKEAKECGLVLAALPRGLAIVAAYTGQEIDPGKYCSRLVMLVAEN